ncbi:hypothetical protein G7054_g8403 [Neopestalotiopsis clavispora]|nr:hypothetical protein G7054_g8403 [Neopestalotiopsis clavispora]
MFSKLILDGGIALVTGAAGGIGKETALAFAEAGARGVVFADVNHEGIKAAAEESSKYARHAEYRALAIKVDLTDAQSVQDLVETTAKEFGRIDYAVNSAGCQRYRSSAIRPRGDGAMAQQEPLTLPGGLRHASRSLGRGSIVLMGSISSLIGAPGIISYTTTKHAVIGIMRAAAVDALALNSGIRVNAVCPGWVDTPMVQKSVEENPVVQYAIDNITPLKRAATVDEVADYIVFLSSPSASFINGTALPIDAGYTLPSPPPLPVPEA